MNFNIQVDDGSETIPNFIADENTNFIQLYDWQRRALEFFFDNEGNVIYEVVTGAGKTFFAIEVIKRLLKDNPDLYTLIVVPKNVILETTWYKELYEAGISLKDIGVYYGGMKEYGKVTITNMQNIDKISLEMFDLAVFDECFSGDTKVLTIENEKYVNKTIKEIVNKRLKCLVPSYNIKTKKIENKEITNWYKIKDKREVLDIELEDGIKLTVTPEQLIFNGEKYIPANKLLCGDKIIKWK